MGSTNAFLKYPTHASKSWNRAGSVLSGSAAKTKAHTAGWVARAGTCVTPVGTAAAAAAAQAPAAAVSAAAAAAAHTLTSEFKQPSSPSQIPKCAQGPRPLAMPGVVVVVIDRQATARVAQLR